VDEHEHHTQGQAQVRDVEDWKIDEIKLEHISHVLLVHPIDEVAQSAGDHEC